ncbi:MAG TPA: PAS domain-containing protein [Candidatus Baltobacteraceae bacterium]|nr:PAS domain-containing protein [Candidatus Baltobacteraceae bacterium]
MREPSIVPTTVERFFPEDEIIVSKTDLKGHITYANETFLKIAGYTEAEVLGKAHSIIRHPDMPRCVFKLLWDTLGARSEIFAYVKNMAKSGDFYWVFAHVTPTFDDAGRVIGYHSSRRVPERAQVELFTNVYAQLVQEEKRHADWRSGMEAAGKMLLDMIASKGMKYDEFIFSV